MRSTVSAFVFAIFSLALLVVSLALLPGNSEAQDRFRGMTTAPSVQRKDLEVLRSWRANIFRWPLSYGLQADTATREEYFTWLQASFETLDALLGIAQEQGLKMVVLLYSPPGGFQSHQGPALHRLFVEQWAQDAFLEAWQMIAERYKDHPASYGYDILNEPAERLVGPGLKDWNQLAQAAAEIIRAIDPDTRIIVEPVYGNQARLKNMIPLTVSNVTYSIHMYYPLAFHHQGLYGKRRGITYPSRGVNKKSLRDHLLRAIKFKKDYGVPIYVGEFTANRWAPGDSGLTYLKDVIDIFERNRWDWTYHAFREADVWSVEHDNNIRNKKPAKKQTARAKLLKKHFRKNRFQ
jgi:endoglucanase